MIEHLDSAHPYWEMEELGSIGHDCRTNFEKVSEYEYEHFCIDCRAVITPETIICPQCGADTSELVESSTLHINTANSDTLAKKRLLGVVGSLILFVGVFMPIVSLPFIGTRNYFSNGQGDGVIILILAVISLLLTFTNSFRGLWFTGGSCLAVMLFTFLNLQMRLSDAKAKMETDLAGNPFRGIADAALQSVQIEWGWAVLIVGAAMLLFSASLDPKRV